MGEEYKDIDTLEGKLNDNLNKQIDAQNQSIDTSTNMNIENIQREKEKQEAEALKTSKNLYRDYKKQISPYGANEENLWANGLGGSGYSESSRTSLYNTYQNQATETINALNSRKKDYDIQISQARQTGDLQKATNIANMFEQQMSNLLNIYNIRTNKEQFIYQKGRDTIADNQWQQEYDNNLKQQEWENQYNQRQADLAQEKWEKEYALQKKTANSRSSGGYTGTINPYVGDGENEGNTGGNVKEAQKNTTTRKEMNLEEFLRGKFLVGER